VTSRTSWRLVSDPAGRALPVPGPLGAAYHMAVDEAIALAYRAGNAPPTVRFYTWPLPALTVGSFQSVDDLLDRGACEDEGIRIVRRITGGGAVLHQDDLTYSIVENQDSPIFSESSISGTFGTLSRVFVRAFEIIGMKATIHESPGPASRATACFASPSRFEILLQGRKVIGSAQRRWPQAFLQQGSIPIDSDPNKLNHFLRPPYREVTPGGAAINVFSPIPVTVDRFKQALIQGIQEILGIRIFVEGLTDSERQIALTLAHEKYGNDLWTTHRKIGPRSFDKSAEPGNI
jgi:lipoyl(octanoyl) transferase